MGAGLTCRYVLHGGSVVGCGYGFILCSKCEGLVVSCKHNYRLYREEVFNCEPRRPSGFAARVGPSETTADNQRWPADFVSDQLINERKFGVLYVTGNFNRELVGQLVAF